MKVTELLRGVRGGESLAHERGVPFVSCSVAVQLVGLLRISGKKKKYNNKKKQTTKNTKDFLREGEGRFASGDANVCRGPAGHGTGREGQLVLLNFCGDHHSLCHTNKLRGFTSWTLLLTSVMRLPTE